MNEKYLISLLFKHHDVKYDNFNCKIANSSLKTIGVRVPVVRQLAKEIVKNGMKIDNINLSMYLELTMLYGFYMLLILKKDEDKIDFLNKYLPYVDSWTITDTITPMIKPKNIKLYVQHLGIWQSSKDIFVRRFSYIFVLDYLLTDKYICLVPSYIKNDSEYYVKMSIAWLISTMLIKYYNFTVSFLASNNLLDDWTFNKSIQKACESYRISNEQKLYLKSLKRRSKI